jgi:hypothetical protein
MPKGFPEITCKSNIPIRDYGLGKTIQLDNLIKIELPTLEAFVVLVQGIKWANLEKRSITTKIELCFFYSLWKPKHKIHTYILPRASGNEQWGVKTSILFSMLS